jgi:hypothetical protein
MDIRTALKMFGYSSVPDSATLENDYIKLFNARNTKLRMASTEDEKLPVRVEIEQLNEAKNAIERRIAKKTQSQAASPPAQSPPHTYPPPYPPPSQSQITFWRKVASFCKGLYRTSRAVLKACFSTARGIFLFSMSAYQFARKNVPIVFGKIKSLSPVHKFAITASMILLIGFGGGFYAGKTMSAKTSTVHQGKDDFSFFQSSIQKLINTITAASSCENQQQAANISLPNPQAKMSEVKIVTDPWSAVELGNNLIAYSFVAPMRDFALIPHGEYAITIRSPKYPDNIIHMQLLIKGSKTTIFANIRTNTFSVTCEE